MIDKHPLRYKMEERAGSANPAPPRLLLNLVEVLNGEEHRHTDAPPDYPYP